jgi:ketosteroid isomerase-like protein
MADANWKFNRIFLDGKVVRFNMYTDTVKVLEAVGAPAR